MTTWRMTGLTAIMALTLGIGTATAQMPQIDYLGYGWETGGFPDSDPGDELSFACTADNADALFDVDLGSDELSFHVSGLISGGQMDIGTGHSMITYSGGTLEVYRDATPDAAWGEYPGPATAPDTFTDGSLFFRGAFTSFTIYLSPNGSGAYEGTLNGLEGEIISDFCSDCVYTWGGSFTKDTGAQIPRGYDLQMDGVLEIDAAVPAESTSWSALKALYR